MQSLARASQQWAQAVQAAAAIAASVAMAWTASSHSWTQTVVSTCTPACACQLLREMPAHATRKASQASMQELYASAVCPLADDV